LLLLRVVLEEQFQRQTASSINQPRTAAIAAELLADAVGIIFEGPWSSAVRIRQAYVTHALDFSLDICAPRRLRRDETHAGMSQRTCQQLL
jgi:hypothetical protein